MKRKLLCLALAFIMVFGLCGCSVGGKYKTVKSLDKQEYSIGFRNGDSTYHYIDKALKELSYEGVVDELAYKWFGSSKAVSFPSEKNALEELGYIESREFIIGVDLDFAPLCIVDGEDYSGFDVELARAVCEKLGWTLKIQPIQSEKAFVELNSGNIDCAWGGVVLDTQSVDYTILVTYMSDKLVIAAKSGMSGSLNGKTLYIGTAQYYLDILTENERIANRVGQISRIQGGAPEYFDSLFTGACDFILTTESAVDYFNTH